MFAAIAVSLSLLIGYAVMEAAYRGYLYMLYVGDQNLPLIAVDVKGFTELAAKPGGVRGFYYPSKPITFTQFDPAGRLLQRHTTPINNYGWPTQHDFSRARAPGEFRIAMVGDSMTASINNAKPWPDVVQRHLNADHELLALLGATHINVLNLGVAGASMQFMAVPLAVVAKRFSPDMVVVNFIGHDLGRRHSTTMFSRANPTPDLPPEPAVPDDSVPQVVPPDLVINGIGIDLHGCNPPRDLTNPDCRVSSYVYVQPGVHPDSNDINKLKRELGARVYWSRVFWSPKPLLLLDVIGRPAVRVPPRQSFRSWFRGDSAPVSDVTGMTDASPSEEDIEIGAGSIRFIKSISKDVMVTHNPLYGYLTGTMREPGVDALAAALKADKVEITRMVKYLPAGKDKTEWFTWYNLPHDGHWSDYGAEIYGEAMYKAVRERLIASRRKPEGTAATGESSPQSAN